MNKRITSLLLCFVLILTMLATAVPALAAGTSSFTIAADRAEANPGDTITYTVTMGAVSRLDSLKFKLVIPEGLTIVPGSGTLATGLKDTLKCVDTAWTESTKVFYVTKCDEGTGYSSANPTELMKIQCTVDAGASGNLTVDFIINPNDCYDPDYDNITFSTTPATVNVAAAPVAVTGVTIDETLSVNIGQTKTPSFTVAPAEATNKTVSFTSSDTSVATVNATTGEVTGVKKGTATITVKTADGNFTDTCTVTVSCAHTNKSTVPAQDSTCTVKGWDEYKECNDCGQLFDKDGNEISAIPYLPLADHTPAQTATDEYLQSAATCTSAAVYFEHCSVCGVKLNTTFISGSTVPHTESGWKSDADDHWKVCTVCGTITTAKDAHTPDHEGHATEEYAIKCTACDHVIEAQLSHTHSLTPVAANPATCTTDGNTAYYVCSGCSKLFADAAGNEEITDHSSVVIGHPGHDWKDATCAAPKTCSRCDATEGSALGHNFATVWSSNATKHWHACSRCDVKADEATHTPDHQGHATEEYAIKCTECGYEMEAQLAPSTPVTNIAATVTAPALGQKPDYAPVIVANPADSVDLEEVYWYKIAAADFTGTDEDTWDEMEADEVFEDGYYYSVDMYFDTNDGYKMSESTTGTVNGMPHDDTYGELYEEGDSAAYLCGLFEPLAVEYTIDLPFSLAVKLTGDEKPAKETFKFEIYDLGVEDAEFEILNDSVTAENIAFDENGVAFIEGIIKIKVTGEDQLCNLTEGFSVRMVKGSTKGWTYASEQWRIEPFFENDALDLKIAVKEIVDGEISEEYANGMSFSVSYEAVTEPETPKTGDNSMMVLWIALLFVSGVGATAIYSRKRKSSAK